MKKLLTIILALVLALSMVACTGEPAETKSSEDIAEENGETLNYKTPMEVYNAAVTSLGALTAFEVAITEHQNVTYLEESFSETTAEGMYKTDGSIAYYKANTDEMWYGSGNLYTSNTVSKEKNEMTKEFFDKNVGLSTADILLPLEEQHFFGVKFVAEGDYRYLDLNIIPDQYEEMTGIEVEDVVGYRVTFDASGAFVSATRTTSYKTQGGFKVTTDSTMTLKASGNSVAVSLPADEAEYRVPVEADEIDKTALASLDSVQLSANNGKEKTDYVQLEIANYGKIIIKLYPEVAPKTVENFKSLVAEGFYDGLTFHRIIKDFVVQGGDPDGDGTGGNGETKIVGEFAANGFTNNLAHKVGVVSMARGTENNSASSQFFIVQGQDQSGLDGNYAAFGYVVYGMDVVDAMANVEVDENDKPTTSVVLTSARFVTVTK